MLINERLQHLNITTDTWKSKLEECLVYPNYVVSPRGMQVSELINGSYSVPIPAYIDLKSRKVNHSFMFAEAAWVLSGANRLDKLTPYLKGYAEFSDDGIFMKGSYGPKVVDQLPYVVEVLNNDRDTRQAVLTIWRERPGPSKDIPCTVAMQFLIREGFLHLIVTMRSQDIVFGYTFDVLTFSMVAKAVQLLINHDVLLGNLYVNAGSLHLYSKHYKEAEEWISSEEKDNSIKPKVERVMKSNSYQDLIINLNKEAENG